MECVAAGTKTIGRDLFDGTYSRRHSARQDLGKAEGRRCGTLAALGS